MAAMFDNDIVCGDTWSEHSSSYTDDTDWGMYESFPTYKLILLTRRDGQMCRASVSRFGRSGGFGPGVLEPCSSQINGFTIRHFLASHAGLLGEGKDWLAQCQDNVTHIMVLAAWFHSGVAI